MVKKKSETPAPTAVEEVATLTPLGRVVLEKSELDDKITRLTEALNQDGDIYGHRPLLTKQLDYMRRYSAILASRLEMFNATK